MKRSNENSILEKTYIYKRLIRVGVMKDQKVHLRDLHVSDTLCCVGTGTPKDRDEVNKREVFR